MIIDKEAIIDRIEDLLQKAGKAKQEAASANEMYSGAITLIELIYGENSHQLKALSIGKESIQWFTKADIAIGALKSLEAEINADLIPSIEKRITGEFFADFISMAKDAIANDYKDVAAVLASAAIEDSFKKLGEINGLNLEDKDMSEVINALKSKELLKGTQVKIASSYIALRNKAFHAQWDKIDTPEVKSLIAFTEEFIIRNFS